MPELRCPFSDCSEVVTEDDKDIAITMFNAHICTHTAGRSVEHSRSGNKSEKIARPKISQGMMEESWNSFKLQWKIYKSSASLSTADGMLQLIYCCEQSLLEHVLRSDPDITTKSEDEQLKSIGKLCVVPVAMGVRRSEVLNLTQGSGELSRSFLSRIKGKAATCDFSTKCTAACCASSLPSVDFSEVVIKYVLVNGLSDADIRREVLGWKELDDSTLLDTIAFIEGKEMARDAYKGELSAVKSEYKKQQDDPKLKIKIKCGSCDSRINQFVLQRSGKLSERKFCPKCWRAKNEKPITRLQTSKDKESVDETSALLSVGAISQKKSTKYLSPSKNQCRNQKDRRVNISARDPVQVEGINTVVHKGSPAVVLSHHIFSKNKGWLQRRAEKQPTLSFTVSPCESMYENLHLPVPGVKPSIISGNADTCAQSCLWGMTQFYKSGFKKKHLVPVRYSMQVANRELLDIQGAVFLSLEVGEQSTNMMVYVSPDVNGFYMSRQCLEELQVISKNFPLPGECAGVSAVQGKPDDIVAECGCLRRQSPPARPKQLPFVCKEENIEAMKGWIMQRFESSTFNKCTHQPLPFIQAEPMKLHVDPNAKPIAHHSPLIVPLHFRDKVKEGLDADERLGVIERVPEGVPTTWLHKMVITAKPTGEPRRTVDLSPLNKHCARETHAVTPPFQQARLIPADTWKSVTDAWSGFHSALIAEEDRHLTSFITEWGQYRYRVAPQGYVSSGDGYTRRYDKIIEKVERKTKITDDTALWDSDLEKHWWRMIDYLELVGSHGIILNPDKLQFCQRTIDFAGFRISTDKIEPLPKYLDAIRTFPTPKKLQDIRSWFGLINQVAHYNQLSGIMAPFRPLLSSKASFYWTPELQEAFDASKDVIINAIKQGVEIFEVRRPTKLQTDYSTSGIGYYLSQKHCSCEGVDPNCCERGWKITVAGSRFLKPAETRYAPIEGECLGVEWALDQTRYFTLGCDPLLVVVDHKPLCGLLNDKALDTVTNTRLFRMKEKTLQWKFNVVYRPGKTNFFADMASRNPTPNVGETVGESVDAIYVEAGAMTQEVLDENEPEVLLIASISSVFRKQLPVKAVTWDLIKLVTKSDTQLQEVIKFVLLGFPEFKWQLSEMVADYWTKRDKLYIVDEVLMCGPCVVIPTQLRPAVLEVLGSAHQGVAAMKARAADAVYWPGLCSDIDAFKRNCQTCRTIQPSQVHNTNFEPRIPSTPFQSLVADYFDLGGFHYLVIADRLSGWPEVTQIKVASSESGTVGLCKALRKVFINFGVATDISTDGASEFTSHVAKEFFKTWGVRHIESSRYFPSSNGRAELAVKAVKRLLRENVKSDGSLDTDRFVRAMLMKRNTPDNYSKLSPAEIVLGRKLSDALPILPKDKAFINNEHIKPAWRQIWKQREESMREQFVRNLETSKSGRNLKPLAIGKYVVLQNQRGNKPLRWDRSGIVVECKPYDQYVVRVHGSNRLTLRNRKFLRSYDPPASTQRQIVLSPYEQTDTLNKGAGKSVRGTVSVQDTLPGGRLVRDTESVQDAGTRREDPRSDPEQVIVPNDSEQLSNQSDQVYSDSEPNPEAQAVPIPSLQVGNDLPVPEPPVRRSNRQNKGETKRFDDYVTGENLEEI